MSTVLAPADSATGPALQRHGKANQWLQLLAGLTLVAVFLPYPALRIGRNTGLQLGHIALFLATPFAIFCSRSRRAWKAVAWIGVPAYISLFINQAFLVGRADSRGVNATVVLLMSVVAIPVGSWIVTVLRRAQVAGIVGGVTIFHSVIGFLQLRGYAHGQLPFLGVMTNPSFADLRLVAVKIATFQRRPFGFFPEPSAMAACLGPWLVLILVFLRRRSSATQPWQTMAGMLAIVAGLLLIIASKSGMSAVVVAAIVLVLVIPGASDTRTASLRRIARWARIATVVVLIAPLAATAVTSALGTRVSRTDDSWATRLGSVSIAAVAWSQSPVEVVIGVGPGRSPDVVEDAVHSGAFALPAHVRPTAVFSALGSLMVEYGILEMLAVALLLFWMFRGGRNLERRSIVLLLCFVWVVATGLTTSYFALLPPWLFAGALMAQSSWDSMREHGHA